MFERIKIWITKRRIEKYLETGDCKYLAGDREIIIKALQEMVNDTRDELDWKLRMKNYYWHLYKRLERGSLGRAHAYAEYYHYNRYTKYLQRKLEILEELLQRFQLSNT